MRKLILALSAATLAVPAVPAAALSPQAKEAQSWRGSDGRVYCKRPNGTVGLVVGGAAGMLGGRAIDRRGDRGAGTILGSALGALLGQQVQRSLSGRCR